MRTFIIKSLLNFREDNITRWMPPQRMTFCAFLEVSCGTIRLFLCNNNRLVLRKMVA